MLAWLEEDLVFASDVSVPPLPEDGLVFTGEVTLPEDGLVFTSKVTAPVLGFVLGGMLGLLEEAAFFTGEVIAIALEAGCLPLAFSLLAERGLFLVVVLATGVGSVFFG